MNKIPTLFLRDPEHRAHVTRDINPAAAWVLDGTAVPTRKFDGTTTRASCGITPTAGWRSSSGGTSPSPAARHDRQ